MTQLVPLTAFAFTPQTFFYSDMHVGHAMLVKRGYRPAGVDSLMRASLLAHLDESSVLVDLGDRAFKADQDTVALFRSLPGMHFLLPGNHDHDRTPRHARELNVTYLSQNKCSDMLVLQLGRHVYVFTHKPLNVRYSDLVQCLESGGMSVDLDTAVVNVHGHLHMNGYPPSLMPALLSNGIDYWNVSVEKTHYVPYTLDELRARRNELSIREGDVNHAVDYAKDVSTLREMTHAHVQTGW